MKSYATFALALALTTFASVCGQEPKSGDDTKIAIPVSDPISPQKLRDPLKLTDAQVGAYTKYYNAKIAKEKAADADTSLDAKTRTEKKSQIKTIFIEDVKGILTAEQHARFLEIMNPPKAAGGRPDMGTPMTDEQKKMVMQIRDKYKDHILLIQKDKSIDERTRRERLHAITGQILSEIIGILDPQKQKGLIQAMQKVRETSAFPESKNADPLEPSHIRTELKLTGEKTGQYVKLYNDMTEKNKALDSDKELSTAQRAQKKTAVKSAFIEEAKKLFEGDQLVKFDAIAKGVKPK